MIVKVNRQLMMIVKVNRQLMMIVKVNRQLMMTKLVKVYLEIGGVFAVRLQLDILVHIVLLSSLL